MAKRNYKRRDSGLVVADDSIVVPKAGGTIPRPWWSSPYIPTAARATNQIKFVGETPQILFVDGKICFNPECCCEDDVVCTYCSGTGYNAPYYWSVAIGSLYDNECCPAAEPPSGCDSMNGTYILSHKGGCLWSYFLPSPIWICEIDPIGAVISAIALIITNKHIKVGFGSGGSGSGCAFNQPAWSKTYDDDPDCLSIVNDSLLWDPVTIGGGLDYCGSDGTCSITAL